MGEQWYYAKANKRYGPVSTAEFKRLANSGQLAPTDLVWKEGMPAWTPAGQFKALLPSPSPETPFAVHCPCGAKFSVQRDLAGRRIRCPRCQEVLAVPDAKEEAVTQVPTKRSRIADDEPLDVRLSRRTSAREIDDREDEDLPRRKKRPMRDTEEDEYDDDDDAPPRPKKKKKITKKKKKKEPVQQGGGFGTTQAGVAGGVLMIVIAVVWFVVGLSFDRLFFYPPILLVIGIVAIAKGSTGN